MAGAATTCCDCCIRAYPHELRVRRYAIAPGRTAARAQRRQYARSRAARGILAAPWRFLWSAAVRGPPARTRRADKLRQHLAGEYADRRQGQRQRRNDCAHSVSEVDGHPGGILEHAAFVVDPQTAPQDEGIAVIGLRPPGILTFGKVGAGDGCI